MESAVLNPKALLRISILEGLLGREIAGRKIQSTLVWLPGIGGRK